MGIRRHTVHLLARTLPTLGKLSDMRLLTLGVQDCYFTYEEIITFLQRHGIPLRPLQASDVSPTAGFKWAAPEEFEIYRRYIHQKTFFRVLGFSPENICSLDASGYEGADIIHDLNQPVPSSLHSRFDLIFDGGTIHYVLSVKDALVNVCRMCKLGGCVVNFNPIDYSDHGFLGLNADVFREFFLTNGFEQVCLKYIGIPAHHRRIDEHYVEWSRDQFQYSLQPYYTTAVYSVFKKIAEKSPTVPLQSMYRDLHGATRVSARHQRPWLHRAMARVLRDVIDAYFVPSMLVRGLLSIRRGERVAL